MLIVALYFKKKANRFFPVVSFAITMKTMHPTIRNRTAELLKSIRHLLKQHDARQVWIFGSASSGKTCNPRDIDIAIICQSKKLIKFVKALSLLFPTCVVERSRYTRTKGKPSNGLPFHFIVANQASLAESPKLAAAIRLGTRINC